MRASPLRSPKTVAPLLLAIALLGMALAGCMDTADQGGMDDETADPTTGETTEGSSGGSSDTTAGQDPDTRSTGGGDRLASAPAMGHLSVYIKDAPTDHFSEIWVNVSSVDVHLAPGSVNGTDDDASDADDEETDGDGNESTEPDGNETSENNGGNETTESGGNETSDANGNDTAESDENETTEPNGNETAESDGGNTTDTAGGWIVVVNESRSLDLLSFSDPDSRAFLGDAELTTGRYTQIRLHISDAWGIRAEDGEREEIQLANPVARIVRSFQVDPDNSTQVVIDVDLDRSVRSYGPPHAPHGWRMTPVIGKVQVAIGSDDRQEDLPDPE